jgi:hypothetical protein
MLYVVLPPSHNIRHSRCGHEVLRRSEKVGCIENEEEREGGGGGGRDKNVLERKKYSL